MQKKTLVEALSHLDHDNDKQWTDDGAPRVDVVASMVGRPVSRADIIAAAPTFSREKPNVPEVQEDPQEKRQRRLADLKDKIRELREARIQIDREIEEACRERDRLTQSSPTGYNHLEDQEARMQFIRSQAEQRAGRVSKVRQGLPDGMKLSDLDPRSPIEKSRTAPKPKPRVPTQG